MVFNSEKAVCSLTFMIQQYDEDIHGALMVALTQTIHDHGPITKDLMGSVSKRFKGTLKSRRNNAILGCANDILSSQSAH